MSQKIKFIYFDISGVLVDYHHDLQKLADENGITIADFDKVFQQYSDNVARGEFTLQDVWKMYHKKLNLVEPENFDFLDYWTDNLTPIEENHQLLHTLSQNYHVGILSNLYTGVLPKLLEKKKIPDISYAKIIQSCEVQLIKPEEKIYQLATELAQVKPEEILYIDDQKYFVETAKELGWNGIWYDKDNDKNFKSALSQFISTPQ